MVSFAAKIGIAIAALVAVIGTVLGVVLGRRGSGGSGGGGAKDTIDGRAGNADLTKDCKGGGTAKADKCGVCGGAGISSGKCDCNGNSLDVCGVCGGDNSTCLDCAGAPNGTAVIDVCGVCGGDNSACLDCAGTPNGTSVIDDCGVCGGDNLTCANECRVGYGGAVRDIFWDSCTDCTGVPDGTAKVDDCGVCEGPDKSGCRGPAVPYFRLRWAWEHQVDEGGPSFRIMKTRADLLRVDTVFPPGHKGVFIDRSTSSFYNANTGSETFQNIEEVLAGWDAINLNTVPRMGGHELNWPNATKKLRYSTTRDLLQQQFDNLCEDTTNDLARQTVGC